MRVNIVSICNSRTLELYRDSALGAGYARAYAVLQQVATYVKPVYNNYVDLI